MSICGLRLSVRAPAQRSRSKFPDAPHCGSQSAKARHLSALRCAIADLALDDEDRFAVVPFSRCGNAGKMHAAKVHRQTERGIKRRGLRHGPDNIGTLGNNCRVSQRKSENKALQT